MADVTDSKSVGSNTVWVQVPPPAPLYFARHPTKFLDVFYCSYTDILILRKEVIKHDYENENSVFL